MAKNKSQYDSTLNLPKTLFEMRAGLPKKEPVMLKDWDDNDLYNQLIFTSSFRLCAMMPSAMS